MKSMPPLAGISRTGISRTGISRSGMAPREYLRAKPQARIAAKRRAPDDALMTIAEASSREVDEVLAALGASREGLTEAEAEARLDRYGFNEAPRERPPRWYAQLPLAFKNPFIILLMGLAAVSWLTGDLKATIIISIVAREYRTTLARRRDTIKLKGRYQDEKLKGVIKEIILASPPKVVTRLALRRANVNHATQLDVADLFRAGVWRLCDQRGERLLSAVNCLHPNHNNIRAGGATCQR
jgi:hypothetical protein